MIEAYVTNLGRYNEGDLLCDWLKFPTSIEEVKDLFSRVGIDGVLYEEYFITDYAVDEAFSEVCVHLGQYESLDELNYFAALLEELDESELEKFGAMVAYGNYTGSVKDLINLSQNLDNYEYFPGVHNDEDLGYYMIDELSALEVPDNLISYLDYEAYGRDIALENGGEFADGGYIEENYGHFAEHYTGIEDIPDEYRIFSYPDPPEKMSIKERLAMYGSMVTAAHAADHHTLTHNER